MKQDTHPLVTEIVQAARIALDELDRTVKTFGAGITDTVPVVVEQSGSMAP